MLVGQPPLASQVGLQKSPATPSTDTFCSEAMHPVAGSPKAYAFTLERSFSDTMVVRRPLAAARMAEAMAILICDYGVGVHVEREMRKPPKI